MEGWMSEEGWMMDGRFYREGDEFYVLMSVEFEVSVEGY